MRYISHARSRLFSVLLAVASVPACARPQTATPTPPPAASPTSSFRATLDRHLRSIERRALDDLLATVDDRDLMVILPDGSTLRSRAEYEAFHREWFAKTDWAMRFRVEKVIETPGMAYAVVTYTYTDPHGEKARVLTLTFRVSDGAWKLVHDQNTPLPKPAPLL